MWLPWLSHWSACRIAELDCPVAATTWLLLGFLPRRKEFRGSSARSLGKGGFVLFVIHLLMPGRVGVGHGEGPTGPWNRVVVCCGSVAGVVSPRPATEPSPRARLRPAFYALGP